MYPKVRCPTTRCIVVDAPTVQFDLQRPLRGTGVVIVKGDVEIQAGSNSFFNGLLYVDGEPDRARAGLHVRGTIIVNGRRRHGRHRR